MPIEALPQSTARAIGSTSTISDPSSIVKELLDNALDASATSIAIEITQDTVGLIQVKDNGHGIPQEDHKAVCKRGFTSKIRTVEDLRTLGGTSLGFRGEALASAAEMSGGLTVATRVDAEVVGSLLKYGRDGELLSTERTSHPIGTTVRISDLFRHIPVRRQTSIKDAKKTITKIRKMVQAYAMARPTTRLSFKLLKSKLESSNWMYAPGRDATLREAAMQVVGIELVSMCVIKEWPAQTEDNSSFRLVGMLPRPVTDFAPLNNKGQYISIDGRPMASGRGITQDILKLYKSHLRSLSHGDSTTITDPFLYLHFRCPGGVYDVNVEPLKDDVLFEDKTLVLSLVENLLQDTYGKFSNLRSSTSGPGEQVSPVRTAFDALLPAPRIEHTSSLPNAADSSAPPSVNIIPARPQPHYQSPPEHKTASARPSELFRGSKNIVSPSAVGRIHTTGQLQPSPRLRNGVITQIYPTSHHETTPHRTRGITAAGPGTLSPISNMDMNVPTLNSTSHSHLSSPATCPTQLSPTTPVRNQTQTHHKDRVRGHYDSGTIDAWFHRVTQASSPPENTRDQAEEDGGPSLSVLAQRRFGESASHTSALGLESNESQSPDTSPASKSPQVLAPTHVPRTKGSGRRKGLPVLEEWSAKIYADHNDSENLELQRALDFEIRKKAAVQERRMQLQTAGPSGNPNSPHKNRYISARSALASEPQPRVLIAGQDDIPSKPLAPVLNPHDPRAYLKRFLEAQEKDSANTSKLKRVASTKLPFEKIPVGHDLHNVMIERPAELPLLYNEFKLTSKEDSYTHTGDKENALTNLKTVDIELWTSRLTALVTAQYKAVKGTAAVDLHLDFSHLT
ncbi:Putative DNA mismatch repair enzyme [Aspergillus calidoustus]|uniref:Putative DNA mismatch repair enzyme n=1 Tax=Aspergillus calidoustus TaxID=454130 RepID=A0A0U5CEQ5_ASPCI|nr:Putative DNA mismatch repair enzyme [Aspergillus calidoustus]